MRRVRRNSLAPSPKRPPRRPAPDLRRSTARLRL